MGSPLRGSSATWNVVFAVTVIALVLPPPLARADDYPPAGYLDSQQDCPLIYEYWPDYCNEGHEVFHYSSNNTYKNGVTSCGTCTCLTVLRRAPVPHSVSS
jgi:hypothetical protein